MEIIYYEGALPHFITMLLNRIRQKKFHQLEVSRNMQHFGANSRTNIEM